MGIFSRKPEIVEAQYAPQVMNDTYGGYVTYVNPLVTREEAMSIPTVARCRNLITSVVASLPLNYYKKSTGEEVSSPRWLNQPSPSQPRSITLAWLIDSLFFHGVGYLEITSTYLEDGRVASMEWVSNDRVSYQLDYTGTRVERYYVNGIERPMSGVGSLITVQGYDEGLLNRAGKLLRQAANVQEAASTAAESPMPTGFLKNSGADLPAAEVQGLLASWKNARRNRSTAYLTSTLDYQTTSYSPEEMGYTKLLQYLATELARACNIPAYMVSAEANQSMTYSNVVDERKQFVDMSLAPFIKSVEDRFSMDDMTTAGHYVSFDLDSSFLRTDPMQRLMVTEKLLSLGLITPEQAMEMEDLSPNGNESEVSEA